MKPDHLAYLDEHRERLGLVLLRHCITLLSFRYGRTSDGMLPRGKSPEEVVIDVLEKYLTGERKFSNDHPVEAQLKRGVESWLSALFGSGDGRLESFDELGNPKHASAALHSDSPDVQAENSHDLKVLFKMLQSAPEVRRSRELQRLVSAIETGADDVPSQVAVSGLTSARVYELRKTLKIIVPEILKQFNGGATLCP